MTLQQRIVDEVAALRRYAACLTGSRAQGDELVRASLELAVEEPGRIDPAGPRASLFRAFHLVHEALVGADDPSDELEVARDAEGGLDLKAAVARLPTAQRAALLLVLVEDFDYPEAALILGIGEDAVFDLYAAARGRFEALLAPPVLIVEDDVLVAEDLSRIVGELGHGVRRTAGSYDDAKAAAAAMNPGLLLIDLRLKDGDLGVRLARELRAASGAPAIFITAFPERVRDHADTGNGTYLVPKPFHAEFLKSTIRDALALSLGQAAPVRPS